MALNAIITEVTTLAAVPISENINEMQYIYVLVLPIHSRITNVYSHSYTLSVYVCVISHLVNYIMIYIRPYKFDLQFIVQGF